MRKVLVSLVIVGLLYSGCSLIQTVCHPTEAQQQTVAQYKAQAVILLAFLQTQIPDPTVQAAIAGLQFAISVYDQVIGGVCVAADVILGADKVVTTNQTFARSRLGYRR